MKIHKNNVNREQPSVQAEKTMLWQQVLNCGEKYLSDDYVTIIVQFNGDLISAMKNIDYACAFIISPSYAIVAVEKGKKDQLFKEVKELIISETSITYFLTAISPIDTAKISNFHDNPYLNLRGAGVLVGMVDTGIDYLNIEFQTEDDRTRITSLWDQTSSQGLPPENYPFGTEYSRDQINRAIQASKNGGDPYNIVNSKDEIGHGTANAGIIGARGREIVVGGAPDCEFAIVKLKQAKLSTILDNGIFDIDIARPIYETADILFGVSYLLQLQIKLRKPMVIFVPLGSNGGGHDGSSLLERYIDFISLTRGLIVVTGTGNQGTAENHASGILKRTGDINIVEVNVDPAQKGMAFFIYGNKPDKISVGITSPSGETVEKVPIKINQQETIKFVYEESIVNIVYSYPEIITGDVLIKITIENIKGGIWLLRIIGDFIVNGRYDIWTYSSKLLRPGSRFLNPDPDITLQLPSTSRAALVSATYNQDTNTLYPPSGRGFTRDMRVKPDLTAGGFEVLTVKPGGGTVVVSGSSPASAVLASAVALLLQWGIVEGNDPNMYVSKVRTYLIRGTRKRPGDVYPNPEWGYGILDLEGTFNSIRNIETLEAIAAFNNNAEVIEVLNSKFYFNVPHQIYKGIQNLSQV
jgi:subtilisin family serine protease